MSLSDCPKCWDTPCVCGYNYSHWSGTDKNKMVKHILNILHYQNKNDAESILKMAIEKLRED